MLSPSRSRSSTQSQSRGPTARSSSASPYPFHPDRLDPASPPNSAESYDNSVNWYYSSYNNENTDPYIGPKGGVGSSSWTLSGSLLLSLATVIISRLV